MRSSIWSKRRISPSQGHRTARSSSVLFRASWTCATARVTDRPVPSFHGRARTTTIPPVGAGGPAWEPPDGSWGTSTSTSAMTQASTANAPDFFSSLLDHPGITAAVELSGATLQELAQHSPQLIDKLKRLVDLGQVELLGSTWQSPFLLDVREEHFARHVRMYLKLHPEILCS